MTWLKCTSPAIHATSLIDEAIAPSPITEGVTVEPTVIEGQVSTDGGSNDDLELGS